MKEEKETKERLDILNHSNDGFKIASEDLRLRGPGDLFGIRQSGEQVFLIADIFEDAKLLQQASKEAKEMSADEKALLYKKNERLRNRLNRYLGQVTL